MISQKDNLLFQSYYSVSFLVELVNNKFLETKCFEEMTFGAPWIKKEIKELGIDNQGSLMMSLYAMLVIPRELIFDQCPAKADEVQKYLRDHSVIMRNDYNYAPDDVNFLRRIRNSVSHADVTLVPKKSVIFADKNPRNGKLIEIKLGLDCVGSLLEKLQEVHFEHIKANQDKAP